MGWSLKIGSVAGTAVRIHVTFLLFLAWIFGVNYVSSGQQAAWSGLLFMVLLFLCVLLHEFGHIFTARGFGVNTSDVILLPIGGVARLERIPEKPSEEFLIAVAGPLVNVVIAALLVLVAGANLQLNRLANLDISGGRLIDQLAAVNLFLAVFNLIPAFPWTAGGFCARSWPAAWVTSTPPRLQPSSANGWRSCSAFSACSAIRF